jgi:hypothetical protein
MNEKLNIIAIKTSNNKYYITERKVVDKGPFSSVLGGVLVNGEKPKPTFCKNWFVLDSAPIKISKIRSQPNINHRYELQDKDLMSDKLPKVLEREKVATCIDYDWVWVDGMEKYRSLYKEVFDKQPAKEEDVEFDFEILFNVKEVVPPIDMPFNVQITRRESDGTRMITVDDIKYRMIEKIMFPEILLPQRACEFTSKQSYDIVREFLKSNINPEYVKITSDYNFCFEIKRRIKLAKPKQYTVDVNNNFFSKRKRKSKYVKKWSVEKEESCFEMTYSPENYKGYTPIKGFRANNQKELKEKVDNYCKDLVSFINIPLAECSHCDGYGIILPEDERGREDD